MNTPHLLRRLPLVLVFSLCIGFADFARGQTSAEIQAARAAQAQAALDAATARANARRQEELGARTAGPPQTAVKIAPQLPASTVSATTTTASGDLPSLRVAVSQLSESRSSQGQGQTNLTLSVIGEGLSPEAVVRQVNITKAVDNNDKPLLGGRVGSPSSMSMMSMMNRGSMPGGVAQPMRAQAYLGIAPRSADSIKFVEGTIEVFVPSDSNDSTIRIGNIKNHFGRVEDPTLEKYGIVFHFLGDKATEDEARALMSGGGGGSSTRIDGVTGFGYFFRDPSNKLAGVQLQDGKGVPLLSGGGGGGGGPNGSLMSYSLRSPIADDTQLVIYMAVPEAIKVVPFRVEDIALP